MNVSSAHSEISALAGKLLRHIRNRLFLQYRYLEPAIYRLVPNECDEIPGVFGTDGCSLYYDPKDWLRRFHNDSTLEIRRYLHSLFHCIYLHPFVPQTAEPKLAELACDITIEAAISAQFGDFATPLDNERILFVKKIQQSVDLLTLPEVLKYLRIHAADTDIDQLHNLFKFDDHLWMAMPDTSSNHHGNNEDDNENDSECSEETEQQADDHLYGSASNLSAPKETGSDHSSESSESEDEKDHSEQNPQRASDSENNDLMGNGTSGQSTIHRLPHMSLNTPKAEEWKDAARRIMVDMESFSCQGSERGLLEKNIAWLTRDDMDYSDFLRQFAVMEERMMIDPDEFDVIYYTYGLGLPGRRKLLIEPLEYREVMQIREFVIAIDTSGSTSGELVQKFLNKTYSILKSTEMFTSAVNIHIIQCDAAIQEDIAIHTLQDIEAYAKDFKVKGQGGTDFRPVFRYVDKLRTEGAFSNLCGLIYFTDGWGTYPNHPTDYKTAFVFLDKYEECRVPAWALKAYWREE